jgi:hypothetical protein
MNNWKLNLKNLLQKGRVAKTALDSDYIGIAKQNIKKIGVFEEHIISIKDLKSDIIDAVVFPGSIEATLESKVLYVDLTYGDDATAVINSPSLAYATYTAARTASVSGDLIVLRANATSYGVVTLKDGVNIYAQAGTTAQRLSDNGVAVTCVIKGALNLSNTGNDTFQVTGASNVHAELNEIYSEGSALRVKPGAGTCNVYLSVVRVYGVIDNGLFSVGNGANFTVDVAKDMSTGALTTSFSGVGLFTFTGTLTVNCPYIFLGDSNASDGSGLLRWNTGSSTASRVTINAERIESIFDHATPNRTYGSVAMQGAGRLEINCKDFSTIAYPCFQMNTSQVNAVVKFTGSAYCEREEVLRLAGSGRFIAENAMLHRGSGDTDDNRVIVVGNPAGAVTVFQSQANNNKLELKNCTVVKTSAGTAGNDPEVIMLDGTGGEIFIKDTDIIVQGTPAIAAVACDAGSIAEGNVYFRNTFATEVLGVNAVPTEILSGFIGGDTVLDTLDTIH